MSESSARWTGPSREEVAEIEVGHTTVSARVARLLVAAFLTAMVVMPAVELTSLGAMRAQGRTTAWSHLARLPAEIRSALGDASEAGRTWWRAVVAGNRSVLLAFSLFEVGLEDESLVGRTLRPPAQVAMTRWLGAGNERVYRGRDGWLFYRPDVEYVTGPGFLEPSELRRRVADAAEWDQPPEPDPRTAIVQFHRELGRRGIALVVVPTPVKPVVHPERLAGRFDDVPQAVQNPSYQELVATLEREGVAVFDPSDVLIAARRGGPQYLATDTHWRPEAMEAVVERLAAFISARVDLPPLADPGYRIAREQVRGQGDTARMLDLPGPALYPPEHVWLRRVLQPDGLPWQPSREADVLVLGDSFSNVYALESMGWGTSAGLVEQLSDRLRRPVDRLVQNDQGAFATRTMLWRDLRRLEGKRVVVYQFATRELAFGDWQLLP